MRTFLPVFTLVILLSSCLTSKVIVNTPYQNGIPIDTLNLLSIMIGPPFQPTFPLIDAAAFNEKTNKIADQILDEEQKAIENFKDLLVANLNGALHLKTQTIKDFSTNEIDRFVVNSSIQIENNNFPIVFFGAGDINIVEWNKGKNVNNLFKDDDPYLRASIQEISRKLNIDNIAISFNRLSIVGVSAFGIKGNLRLESFLFIYNSNGHLVIDSMGWTKPLPVRGNEIRDYKFQLDSFIELARLTAEELSNYIK
ncbi:MAG: hypothetical protein ACFHWX_02465 [Bacteroidota bacterium]